jgi:hypothetical protein
MSRDGTSSKRSYFLETTIVSIHTEYPELSGLRERHLIRAATEH